MYLCLIEQNSKIGPCVKLQKQGTFIFRRYVNIEEQSNYEPGIGWYKWIRSPRISRSSHFEISYDEEAEQWQIKATHKPDQVKVFLDGKVLQVSLAVQLLPRSKINIKIDTSASYDLLVSESTGGSKGERHMIPLSPPTSNGSTDRANDTGKPVSSTCDFQQQPYVLNTVRIALQKFLSDVYYSAFSLATDASEERLLSTLSELTGGSRVLVVSSDSLISKAEMHLSDEINVDRRAVNKLLQQCDASRVAALYDIDEHHDRQLIVCPFRHRDGFVVVAGRELLFEDLVLTHDLAFAIDHVNKRQDSIGLSEQFPEESSPVDRTVEDRKVKVFGSLLEDPAIREIAETLADVAKTNLKRVEKNKRRDISERYQLVRIYFEGERGVGKSYFARCYANLMGWQINELNCAAYKHSTDSSLPFQLLGGILLNSPNGKSVPGMIEKSKGQVLFLDEVGSLHGDGVFLDILDTDVERLPKYKRAGGSEDLYVEDVAWVFAYNRELPKEFEESGMKGRLHFGVTRTIPPLSARKEEHILKLANRLIKKHGDVDDKVVVLSKAQQNEILSYRWIENVRQLEDVVKELVRTPDRQLREIIADSEEKIRVKYSDPKMDGGISGFVNAYKELPPELKEWSEALQLITRIEECSKGYKSKDAIAECVGYGGNSALQRRLRALITDKFLESEQIVDWIKKKEHFIKVLEPQQKNLLKQRGVTVPE